MGEIIKTVYRAQSDGRLFTSDSLDGARRDANEPVEAVFVGEDGNEISVDEIDVADDGTVTRVAAPASTDDTTGGEA